MVEVEAVLLPLLVSGVAEVTTAVFVNVTFGGAVTLTWIDSVAKPGNPIVPKLAVTVPFDPTDGPLQLPWLALQEMKVVPTGSGSVTFTPSEKPGPALFTRIVYVRVVPLTTGSGESVFEIVRSAGDGVGVGVGPNVGVDVAVGRGVKGVFVSRQFQGIEGVQGPYVLSDDDGVGFEPMPGGEEAEENQCDEQGTFHGCVPPTDTVTCAG